MGTLILKRIQLELKDVNVFLFVYLFILHCCSFNCSGEGTLILIVCWLWLSGVSETGVFILKVF